MPSGAAQIAQGITSLIKQECKAAAMLEARKSRKSKSKSTGTAKKSAKKSGKKSSKRCKK